MIIDINHIWLQIRLPLWVLLCHRFWTLKLLLKCLCPLHSNRQRASSLMNLKHVCRSVVSSYSYQQVAAETTAHLDCRCLSHLCSSYFHTAVCFSHLSRCLNFSRQVAELIWDLKASEEHVITDLLDIRHRSKAVLGPLIVVDRERELLFKQLMMIKNK